MTTLAQVSDVQSAGNLNVSLDAGTVSFYLDLGSFFIRQLVGDETYADAISTTPAFLSADEILRMKKAEALMTVGLLLPSLGVVTASAGAFRTMSVGTGNTVEVLSFVKEIQELAGSFMSLAQNLIPDLITDTEAKTFWSHSLMKVFPSLDEVPTVAPIGSLAERLIKRHQSTHRE